MESEFKSTSKESHYFLGLEIEHDKEHIKINQEANANEFLNVFSFWNVSYSMFKSSEIFQAGREDKIA